MRGVFVTPIARSGPSSHHMTLTNDNDMFLGFGLQGVASSLCCWVSEELRRSKYAIIGHLGFGY